jgi:hypothetical protein
VAPGELLVEEVSRFRYPPSQSMGHLRWDLAQIFVARETPTALRTWFASASVQRIVNLARDMQVTVVADRSTRHAAG